MSTVQSMFDKIWDYFIVQKNKPGVRVSQNGNSACSYSAPCAVGILFSESDRLELDRNFVLSTQQTWARERRSQLSQEGAELLLEDDHVAFMLAVRWRHDSLVTSGRYFHEQFENSLRSLAESWKLKIPEAT